MTRSPVEHLRKNEPSTASAIFAIKATIQKHGLQVDHSTTSLDTDYDILQAGILSGQIQVAGKGTTEKILSGEKREFGLWIN